MDFFGLFFRLDFIYTRGKGFTRRIREVSVTIFEKESRRSRPGDLLFLVNKGSNDLWDWEKHIVGNGINVLYNVFYWE